MNAVIWALAIVGGVSAMLLLIALLVVWAAWRYLPDVDLDDE